MRSATKETVKRNRDLKSHHEEADAAAIAEAERTGVSPVNPADEDDHMTYEKGVGLISKGKLAALKKTQKKKKVFSTDLLFAGVNNLIERIDADPNSAEKWTRHRSLMNPPPQIREGFGYCAIDRRMYLFGGIGGATGGRRNDLWMIDLAAPKAGWTRSRVRNNVPPPRSGHTLTAMPDHELWVFGGEGEYDPSGKAGTQRQIFGDLYKFSLVDRAWSFVPTLVGAPSFLPP
jgi:hypothetical protein